MRRTRCLAVLLTVLILLPGQGPLLAQAAPGDPEVARGVRQVDEGDYDAAILTLDAAARRLSPRSPGSPDLAQAYLFLGIAYLAKGHETSARARFREALGQVKDLKLSPERFAPRVVEVFEEARAEASAARSAPPSTPKGGKGKGILILGGLGAAAGVALLASGGGSGGGQPTSTSPAPAPATNAFSGALGSVGGESASIALGPYAAGACRAELSWSDPRTEVRMFVNDAATAANVTDTRRATASSSVAEWSCTGGTRYRVDLFLQEPRVNVSYELRVAHP